MDSERKKVIQMSTNKPSIGAVVHEIRCVVSKTKHVTLHMTEDIIEQISNIVTHFLGTTVLVVDDEVCGFWMKFDFIKLKNVYLKAAAFVFL